MVEFTADSRHAKAESDDYITTGSVGIPVTINLSDDFDDLDVTICFRSGSSYADIMYQSGDDVCIPSEVLVFPGENLQIGVFATSADGLVAIPTIWASCGVVRLGALPSGIDVISPQPNWASEIFRIATNAREIAQSVRDDADNGEFDGEQGIQGIPGPQGPKGDTGDRGLIGPQGPKGDTGDQGPRGEQGFQGVPGEKGNKGDTGERGPQGETGPRGATGPIGPQGPQGPQGIPGVSPTASVEQTSTGATITVTDGSGTTTAELTNGPMGPQGPQGEQGLQGEQGPQGPQGPKGDTGDPAEPGSITDAMLAPDGIKAQVAQLWGNQLKATLTGDLLTAADAYAAPPMALTVDGRSTQDGTPTPEAPVPIVSVDGVELQLQNGPNMLDTSTWVENKYIGQNGQIGSESGSHYTENFSHVMAGTYVFNMHRSSTNGSSVRLHGYDADKHWVRQIYSEVIDKGTTWYTKQNIVIDSDIKYVRVSCHSTMTELHLELGSTATAYEPYQGQTVSLYDGTLCSLPDGTKDTLALAYLRPSTREGWAWYSRELVQAVGEVDLGTLNWLRGNRNNDNTGYVFRSPSDVGILPTAVSGLCTAYENYPDLRYNYANERLHLYQFALKQSTYSNGTFLFCDEYDTAADFKSAVNGVTATYPLATPITTQLDPIELPVLPAPTCTVWADPTTGLTMEYVQDTGIVIANLEAAFADLATS